MDQNIKTITVEIETVREDGRPSFYVVPPQTKVNDRDAKAYKCAFCEVEGRTGLHRASRAYMSDPAESPGLEAYFICHDHLPETAVIFNPTTNNCRDKKGENVWTEEPTNVLQ